MGGDILLLVPLFAAGALSLVLLFLEADLKWKILCLAEVAACAAMSFYPPIKIHFLVPVLIEAALAIALLVWLKREYT